MCIWLSDNKDTLDISASKLDVMHNSLRVLRLRNSIKLKGKCTETFEKLVFFEAADTELPFDVSELKKLRYLSYEPNDLRLSKASDYISSFTFPERSESISETFYYL